MFFISSIIKDGTIDLSVIFLKDIGKVFWTLPCIILQRARLQETLIKISQLLHTNTIFLIDALNPGLKCIVGLGDGLGG